MFDESPIEISKSDKVTWDFHPLFKGYTHTYPIPTTNFQSTPINLA